MRAAFERSGLPASRTPNASDSLRAPGPPGAPISSQATRHNRAVQGLELMNRRIPRHSHIEEAVRPEHRPRVFARGRVCRSCRTVLHRYHEGDYCHLHEKPRPIHGNRSDHRDAIEDFRDLMEEAA